MPRLRRDAIARMNAGSTATDYWDGSSTYRALAAPGGGPIAPADATYVTISLNNDLTSERVLTAGSGISIVDGGAGMQLTLATTGAPPTGTAGGDLSGTYPNPTVVEATNPVFAAGSTSLVSATLTAGALKTAAIAGGIEYDGTCFYTTPVASARGVSPSVMFSIVPAGGFALSTSAGVQSCFPTTGDVWTLQANTTYKIEGQYHITKSGAAVTVALAFAAAASLTVTSVFYSVISGSSAAHIIATASVSHVEQIASTVVTGSSNGHELLIINGIIRVSAGGTLTPQINFSGTPTSPVMDSDSYIMFSPIGSDTGNILGSVA